MITFIVTYNDISNNIEIEPDKKVLDLKKQIIDVFNLKVKYIDLEIVLKIPIRSLGKFNLESGAFPRTFDNYELNRWEIDNRLINLIITEVPDYDPKFKKPIIKKSINGLYRPPGQQQSIESGSSYIEPTYELESKIDFPSL